MCRLSMPSSTNPEIACPAEVVQHEPQRLQFRRRQAGVVDIEYLAGAVGQRLRACPCACVLFRLHQRSDRQRLELLALRLHLARTGGASRTRCRPACRWPTGDASREVLQIAGVREDLQASSRNSRAGSSAFTSRLPRSTRISSPLRNTMSSRFSQTRQAVRRAHGR